MHTYGSTRQQLALNDWTATAGSGGLTTSSHTVNVYAQIETRAGKNLLSAPKNVTVSTGQKLTLTINSEAIKSGEDAFAIVFSIETTGNSSDAVQIAKIKLRDEDQTTIRTLPLYLDLTRDSHFVMSDSVATLGSLPANPINGQMRLVGSDYYEYDDEAIAGNHQSGSGYWIEKSGNFSTYLSATTDEGGCDRHQTLIDSLNYPLIPYAGNGNDHTPLVIWLLNGLTEDGQSNLPIGSSVALEVKINGSVPLASSLSQGLKVKVLGYVRRLTGILDTSISEAGMTYPWEPESPLFFLTRPLPRGYALAVEVILAFRKTQLRGGVTGGTTISTILYSQGKFGSHNPIGWFTGNAIANIGNKMRIVPTSNGFIRENGLAIIGNYVTPQMGSESYAVTVADTANQKVALSGVFAGEAFTYQSGEPIPETQQLRAKFSTEPGEQTPSEWSNTITLVPGQLLTLTVDHPCDAAGITAIRSDYPDIIAGMSTEFSASHFRLYLSINNILYRANTITTATITDTQEFTIDSLSGFSVINSLPINSDNTFGFWDYETLTLTASTGSSSLPTNQPIKYCIAYCTATSNNRVITKIEHQGLEEIPYNLIEAIVRSGAYGLAIKGGTSFPIRGAYNFLDPLFQLTDDSQNNETEITLPGVRRIYAFEVAPTVDNDELEGYRLGDRWFDLSQTPIEEYVCVNPVDGLWQVVGSGGQNGGHTIVNSAGNDLEQQPNLKFNNEFFSLVNNEETSTTQVNIAYTPANQGRTIATENGLTGGGNLSQNRTLGLAYSDLIAENSPLGSHIVAIQTTDGIRKLSLATLLSKLPFVTKGSLLVGDGTNLIQFLVGTNGYKLTADSTAPGGLRWVEDSNILHTTVSGSYTQPLLNETVNITLGTNANLIANLSFLNIETGGRYFVTALSGETGVTIQYLGGGVNSGVQVASGKKATISGKPGNDGITPQTYTSSQFTVPAINATVDVSVLTTDPFNSDTNINIDTAGAYLVTEVLSSTLIRCKNLGETNTNAGVTIDTNSKVIITGRKGDDLSDVQITAKLLSGSVEAEAPTNITATDSILIAFNKLRKYITNFLTNFNAAGQLVRLNNEGKLPPIDGSLLTGISGGNASSNPDYYQSKITALNPLIYFPLKGTFDNLGSITTLIEFTNQEKLRLLSTGLEIYHESSTPETNIAYLKVPYAIDHSVFSYGFKIIVYRDSPNIGGHGAFITLNGISTHLATSTVLFAPSSTPQHIFVTNSQPRKEILNIIVIGNLSSGVTVYESGSIITSTLGGRGKSLTDYGFFLGLTAHASQQNLRLKIDDVFFIDRILTDNEIRSIS